MRARKKHGFAYSMLTSSLFRSSPVRDVNSACRQLITSALSCAPTGPSCETLYANIGIRPTLLHTARGCGHSRNGRWHRRQTHSHKRCAQVASCLGKVGRVGVAIRAVWAATMGENFNSSFFIAAMVASLTITPAAYAPLEFRMNLMGAIWGLCLCSLLGQHS